MGAPSSAGLAPDAPPHPGEWREGSGLSFALAERVHGRPADPLLFALMHRHPLMHDGRRVDAAEGARLATVLMAPERPVRAVPMVEAQPDDEAPAELAPRLKRRSRVAALVPAGKVTGWVPQWKREAGQSAVGSGQSGGCDPAAGIVPPQDTKTPERRDPHPYPTHNATPPPSRGRVGRGGAASATPMPIDGGAVRTAAVVPQSAPQVAPPSGAADSPRALAAESVQSSDTAPQAARKAGAPAVPPPSAGAPVVVAPAAPARQSAPAAPPPGGKRVRAARLRPAAAPAAEPPRSPVAAERGEARLRKARPSIEHIVAVAERAAGIEPGALVPESRRPAVTEARQLALFLAETLLGWDYSRLGRLFGRDRATVRHAIRVVYERRRQDAAFALRLRKILVEARAEPRARRRKIAP